MDGTLGRAHLHIGRSTRLLAAALLLPCSMAHATDAAGRYTSRGLGNRSCALYLESRKGALAGLGFTTWLSGFFTAVNQITDGTEDILAGMGLDEAMEWLETRCRKYPTSTFAAVAYAFVESRRPDPHKPHDTISEHERFPAEPQGSPATPVAPAFKPPTGAESGPRGAGLENVDVQGRGLVSLAPFDCRNTPLDGFVERICYDAANAYLLLDLGGVWTQFCRVDAKTMSDLKSGAALRDFYERSSRRTVFSCPPQEH